MKRTEKESFVAELRERINRAPVVYLTDFTGPGRQVHDEAPPLPAGVRGRVRGGEEPARPVSPSARPTCRTSPRTSRVPPAMVSVTTTRSPRPRR